jgi:hypothetical protein
VRDSRFASGCGSFVNTGSEGGRGGELEENANAYSDAEVSGESDSGSGGEFDHDGGGGSGVIVGRSGRVIGGGDGNRGDGGSGGTFRGDSDSSGVNGERTGVPVGQANSVVVLSRVGLVARAAI